MDSVALVRCEDDLVTMLSKGIELIDGFKTITSSFIINTRVEIVDVLISEALHQDCGMGRRVEIHRQ